MYIHISIRKPVSCVEIWDSYLSLINISVSACSTFLMMKVLSYMDQVKEAARKIDVTEKITHH